MIRLLTLFAFSFVCISNVQAATDSNNHYVDYTDLEYPSNYPGYGLKHLKPKLNTTINLNKQQVVPKSKIRIQSSLASTTTEKIFYPTPSDADDNDRLTIRTLPIRNNIVTKYNGTDIDPRDPIKTSSKIIYHRKNLSNKPPLSLNDTLEEESAPKIISTKFAINHSPYTEEYLLNNRIKYNKNWLDPIETHQLFSTDVTAPKYKFKGNDNGGYFKTQTDQYNSKLNHFPAVKSKFQTDLAVIDLALESYPSSLQNFKHQSVADDFASSDYSSTNDFVDAPIATRGQINLYNEDLKQQKDKIIEFRLRNSKNPADKAKLHQFLKAKEDEKIEQQIVREQLLRGRPRPFYDKRRPWFGHSGGRMPKDREVTLGLGYFKTTTSKSTYYDDGRPYNFPFV